uniref:Uncharacterized protein n=1 Tax=Setaria italica TaxID=4555 RepID=K3YBM4_SETIT
MPLQLENFVTWSSAAKIRTHIDEEKRINNKETNVSSRSAAEGQQNAVICVTL